jgi:murein DD-endopeptidase MepM/ murein hydrolase activator NlpD
MITEAINTQVNPYRWREQLTGRAVDQTDPGNKDVSNTRLKGVVKELEALFIYEMLKEMRQTTQGGFLGKGMGNDIYSSLFDMEMARLFAKRGLGLGELILKQIDGRAGQGVISPSTSPKDPKTSFQNGQMPPTSPTAHRPEDQGSRVNDQKSSIGIPVNGRISSNFGWREDPFSGEEKFHSGIDIAAPSGQAIYPIRKGRVIFSGLTQGYGNTVVIDHGDGYIAKYGHNLTNLVAVGDNVEPDQVIALVGNTGKSTGPHLHFEIQHLGERVNPQELVKFQQGALS